MGALAPVYALLLWADRAGRPWADGAAFGWFLASRLSYVIFVGLVLRARDASGAIPDPREAGEEFRRFRARAAFLMRNDGLAIGLVCWTTRGSLGGAVPPWLPLAAGPALLLAGLGVKAWAARTLEPGAYYWESFFRPDGEGGLARRGPYRLLANPMYTVGYAHAYGLALLVRSLPGLVAAAVAQVLILLFHLAVERPHNEARRARTASAAEGR